MSGIEESKEESKEDSKEVLATDGNNKFKKEKRIDYQNIDNKVKEEKEPVREDTTVEVYNPSNNIVEIDLGRDKSVRLDPYGRAVISSEDLNHPNLQLLKGNIKIIN